MAEELENIIGAKSKIRIIEAMSLENALMSIHSISEKTGVAYSVAYKDIHELKDAGFVVDENKKYRLNGEHPMYLAVRQLFSLKEVPSAVISNRQKKDIAKIVEELHNHQKAQIIMHHNADPDAVGSAVALALALMHMDIRVTVSAPLGISLQARQVLSKYPFHIRDETEKNPSIVFIVDSSSSEQIGELAFRTNPKIVLIDHHQRGNIAKEADLTFIDTDAHSTAILVYRFIVAAKIPVVSVAAPYILSGIVADTAFLRIADKNDVEAMNELLNYVELSSIFDALSVKEDISERIAKLKVLRRCELFRVRDLIIAFSRAGSFESRAATHLIKSGADVAVVSNVKKDEIRISARVRKYLADDIDLVKVLKNIEPLIDGSAGGHAEAASANGKDGKNAGKIVRVLVSEFEKRANSKAKVIT
ncbi:MAG: DHH family phosphoesterase [archaeon]